MIFLRQATASQEVEIGPFVDSTDGNTEETGLTIANTDIKLFKTGATAQANKNSGGATHVAAGMYYITLDATDTDTIGPMKITVHVAGALYVVQQCVVLDEAVFDVLFGTTAPSTLAAGALMGLADDAITAAKITAGAIGSSEAPLLGDINTDVETVVGRILGTIQAGTHVAQSGDSYARLGAPAGASIAADLVVIDNFVDGLEATIGAAGAGLSAVPWNAAWDAEVQSECTDALNAYDGPTNAEMVARTLVAADYVITTDLPAAPDNASITAILEDTGTTLPAAIAALPTDADVNVACDTAISDAALATAANLATVDTVVDSIAATIGVAGAGLTAVGLSASERTALGASLGGRTVGPTTQDRLLLAIAAGLVAKTSGGGTSTVGLRNVADTADLASVTVDANDNRTAVTITWANA